MKKRMMIGLEGLDSSFIVKHAQDLPHLNMFFQQGVHRTLRSCDPPSSIPVWSSVVTGIDPSRLGLYDSYQRRSYKYYKETLLDAIGLKVPRIWEVLSEKGYHSIVMGVPLCSLEKPMKGHVISFEPRSDEKSTYTYPPSLKEEIEKEVGTFPINNGKEYDELYEITKKRFALARYLLNQKEWNFFMMVEQNTAYVSRFFDEEKTLKFFQMIDTELGAFLESTPSDTRVFITSGYGVSELEGGFCMNEWLIHEGYLKLKETVSSPTMLTPQLIDWKKTRVWATGESHGFLWFNVKGRELNGIVPKEKLEYLKNGLIHKLISLTDQNGVPLYCNVIKLSKRDVKKKFVLPDLLVYVRDFRWCCIPSVGTQKIHIDELEKKTNQNLQGFFLSWGVSSQKEGGSKPIHLQDIAPTILHEFGIQPENWMKGNVFSL